MLRAWGLAATPIRCRILTGTIRSIISTIAPSNAHSSAMNNAAHPPKAHELVSRNRMALARDFHTTCPNPMPRKVVGWRKAILDRRQKKDEGENEEEDGEEQVQKGSRRKAADDDLADDGENEGGVGTWQFGTGRERQRIAIDEEDLKAANRRSRPEKSSRPRNKSIGKKLKGPENINVNEDIIRQQLNEMGMDSSKIDMGTLLEGLGVGGTPEEIEEREWCKYA
jgi:hypothetical protein